MEAWRLELGCCLLEAITDTERERGRGGRNAEMGKWEI
jgi:hypothetical protein